MGLIYPSFESRGEIAGLVAQHEAKSQGDWPRDPDGAPLYPGAAHAIPAAERTRRVVSGEAHTLRLDMAAALARSGPLTWTEIGAGPNGETGVVAADPAAWGDVILARKDTPTSYHLAVVVDDAAQGVTDVVRGSDLFHSTGVHRLLQVLLGLPQPAYHHHRLMLDNNGHKLSKSTLATGLRQLRAQGATPADIRSRVGLD
jgi:glutamyl-Q tRNA(Asp) synthetase